MSTPEPTLEERVARLETLLENAVKMAEGHPMGKMVLKMLGLK
jgi:hypothetical protein